MPLLALAGWVGILVAAGYDPPTPFLVVVVIYVLVVSVLNLERVSSRARTSSGSS